LASYPRANVGAENRILFRKQWRPLALTLLAHRPPAAPFNPLAARAWNKLVLIGPSDPFSFHQTGYI
ncbi:MAG: hypothetical protein WBD71_08575, partial [Xanthobacteraceae bacterium]